MPSSPDHVPAARLPLGRAFPKGRAAGRPQGRWAQESWGPGGRGLGGRGAGGHKGRLRPPTGPVGHGCRRPGPLGQPGVRRTMALSSWVFRRPCLSSAVPGASVELGGWGPSGLAVFVTVLCVPVVETIRDTFLFTLWTRRVTALGPWPSRSGPCPSGHLRGLRGARRPLPVPTGLHPIAGPSAACTVTHVCSPVRTWGPPQCQVPEDS